jgi:hypothetical protein
MMPNSKSYYQFTLSQIKVFHIFKNNNFELGKKRLILRSEKENKVNIQEIIKKIVIKWHIIFHQKKEFVKKRLVV